MSQIFCPWVAIFNLSPAYGVFISQFIRYARACSSYECFTSILKVARLSCKLPGQGYVMEHLKSSLMKFYGRYGHLIKLLEVSLSQMLHDILGQWDPPLIRHFTKSWPCYRSRPYYRLDVYLIPGGFQRTFATYAASQQRMLTHPVTWSCPISDFHVFSYWDHSFINLSCLRTFWVANIPGYFYFAFMISILKAFKSLQNFWRRVTDITSFGKRLGNSLGHTLNFCPNLVKYRFRIMFHKESLTLSSTVILFTNFVGSKAKRISSRRARK